MIKNKNDNESSILNGVLDRIVLLAHIEPPKNQKALRRFL